MSTIIAGQYDTFDEAGRAADRLRAAGFDSNSIAVFFNNSPGRHDTFPIGGDEFADPEARPLDEGMAKGAAAGAGVGLAGAASESEQHDDEPQRIWRRPAAVMAAVAVSDVSRERAALDALRTTGAHNIERADGEIRDGDWIDFDPIASPKLVDEPQHSAAMP